VREINESIDHLYVTDKLEVILTTILQKCIRGVMVSLLASSAVGHGFLPYSRSNQRL
jgi:hypothetical protein